MMKRKRLTVFDLCTAFRDAMDQRKSRVHEEAGVPRVRRTERGRDHGGRAVWDFQVDVRPAIGEAGEGQDAAVKTAHWTTQARSNGEVHVSRTRWRGSRRIWPDNGRQSAI